MMPCIICTSANKFPEGLVLIVLLGPEPFGDVLPVVGSATLVWSTRTSNTTSPIQKKLLATLWQSMNHSWQHNTIAIYTQQIV
jgi:hypothetical protein